MNELYKFENGVLVETLRDGSLDATRVEEHSEDVGVEKHLPVVIEEGEELLVKVGEVPHPMEEDHWIEWIEVISEDAVHRKYLKPGMKPEARFPKPRSHFYVREHCNKHGLWARR